MTVGGRAGVAGGDRALNPTGTRAKRLSPVDKAFSEAFAVLPRPGALLARCVAKEDYESRTAREEADWMPLMKTLTLRRIGSQTVPVDGSNCLFPFFF